MIEENGSVENYEKFQREIQCLELTPVKCREDIHKTKGKK